MIVNSTGLFLGHCPTEVTKQCDSYFIQANLRLDYATDKAQLDMTNARRKCLGHEYSIKDTKPCISKGIKSWNAKSEDITASSYEIMR